MSNLEGKNCLRKLRTHGRCCCFASSTREASPPRCTGASAENLEKFGRKRHIASGVCSFANLMPAGIIPIRAFAMQTHNLVPPPGRPGGSLDNTAYTKLVGKPGRVPSIAALDVLPRVKPETFTQFTAAAAWRRQDILTASATGALLVLFLSTATSTSVGK